MIELVMDRGREVEVRFLDGTSAWLSCSPTETATAVNETVKQLEASIGRSESQLLTADNRCGL